MSVMGQERTYWRTRIMSVNGGKADEISENGHQHPQEIREREPLAASSAVCLPEPFVSGLNVVVELTG